MALLACAVLALSTQAATAKSWGDILKGVGGERQKEAESRKAKAEVERLTKELDFFLGMGADDPKTSFSIDGRLRDLDAEITTREVVFAPPAAHAKLEKALGSLLEAAGDSPPPDLLAPWDEAVAKLHRAFDAAAAANGIPRGLVRDARVERLATEELAKVFPGGKQVSAGLAPEWRIEKTERGLPLSRSRAVIVAYRMPEARWCVSTWVVYLENYAGGGRYEPSSRVDHRDYALTFWSCP